MNETLKLINFVNSYPIENQTYESTEWLSILFNRFSKLEYTTTWIDSGMYTGVDVRPMVLFRIESATLWYEQNIISSSAIYENFISTGLKHGYDNDFLIKHTANLREVQNRVAFLDSVYFSIDYFVTQLSKIHNINQQGQGKTKHFSKLLEHFNIPDSGETRNNIIKELRELLPDNMNAIKPNFLESSSSKLPYTKTFEYLSLIRNSLHNNGFANKNMANLTIGPFNYKNIEKNKSLDCMGLPNLILLIIQMINILEKLCLLSIKEKTAAEVDPHLQTMESNLGYYP